MARTMQLREIQPNQLTEPHCVLELAPQLRSMHNCRGSGYYVLRIFSSAGFEMGLCYVAWADAHRRGILSLELLGVL